MLSGSYSIENDTVTCVYLYSTSDTLEQRVAYTGSEVAKPL
jgi:hypothetical protein